MLEHAISDRRLLFSIGSIMLVVLLTKTRRGIIRKIVLNLFLRIYIYISIAVCGLGQIIPRRVRELFADMRWQVLIASTNE